MEIAAECGCFGDSFHSHEREIIELSTMKWNTILMSNLSSAVKYLSAFVEGLTNEYQPYTGKQIRSEYTLNYTLDYFVWPIDVTVIHMEAVGKGGSTESGCFIMKENIFPRGQAKCDNWCGH